MDGSTKMPLAPQFPAASPLGGMSASFILHRLHPEGKKMYRESRRGRDRQNASYTSQTFTIKQKSRRPEVLALRPPVFAAPTHRPRLAAARLLSVAVVFLVVIDEKTSLGQDATKEDPIGWYKIALEKVKSLKDYTCLLESRELTSDGECHDSEMLLKIRHNPKSIFIRFRAPVRLSNAEVLWVEEKNAGKLIVFPGSGFAVAHCVTLPPNAPLAMWGRRHALTEVGMEDVVSRGLKLLEHAKAVGPVKFVCRESQKLGERTCLLFEAEFACGEEGAPVRVQLFIDVKSQLPVRFALSKLSNGRSICIEQQTFSELGTDVGLTNEDFSKSNPTYHFLSKVAGTSDSCSEATGASCGPRTPVERN